MKNIRELVLILLSAGILMLVMGSAGESAKRTRCMGNLKKLYGMTLSYENDHGGLPPVTIPAKPLWKFWSHCLRPYSTDKLDFCCPADKRNEYMFKPESPLFCPVVQSAASAQCRAGRGTGTPTAFSEKSGGGCSFRGLEGTVYASSPFLAA